MPKTIDLTPRNIILIPAKEKIKLPKPSKEDMGFTIGGLEIGSNRLAKGQLVILPHLEQILFGLATSPTAGVGIFIGKDGSDYEFRVGDPSGNNLIYDGTNITITGGTLSAGTISAGTISGATITGGSIDIESGGTHYLTVAGTGVTVIRFHPSAASNFVTASTTAVTLSGDSTSRILFATGTTNETRLSIVRDVASANTTLIVFTDASTTNNIARLMSLVSGSTNAAIGITKIGNGPHFNLAGDPAPASPVDGDFWFDGSNLKIKIGLTVYNIDVTAV